MSGIIGAIGFNATQATECMYKALRHRGIPYGQRAGHMANGLTYSMKALGYTLISRFDCSSNSRIEIEDRRHSSFARASMHNSESLVLTRDSIGSFPLFYGSNDARTLCAFAPERKALWALGIERILRVEPGSVVTIRSPDDITVHAQERPEPFGARTSIDLDDAAHRLLALL
ncbi:MAG: hypothetical protein LUP95_03920, partial [Euryarchaeota archaeon]|nr:hypothetical protein [Euryarchaeota archaeon]